MDYMSEFKPRPETVQLHDALAIELDQLDRRIKTSNNIPSKTLAEHMMTLMLGFHQWVTAQGQDLADYAQAVAGRIEPGGDGGLDEDEVALLEAIQEHLGEVQKLFDEYKALMPENVLKLGERNKELIEGLEEMLAGEDEEDDEETDGEEGEEDDALFADDTAPETPAAKEEAKLEVTDE